MKIEIREKMDKKFYNELICISQTYKKIKKNPNKKIVSNVKMLTFLLVIDLLLLIVFVLDYLETKDAFNVAMLGVIACTVFYILTYFFVTKKMINDLLKNESNEIIEINEKNVRLIQEEKQTVELDWNLIEFILISKYTICLIPKKINNLIIAIPINKKEEFLEGVKKYNKDELIIDNEELYN